MNPLRTFVGAIAGSVLVALFASLSPATAAEPQRVRVVSSEPAKPIYHSPQTPGYTAWTTLWRNPKGELRLAFQQVTGPVEDWAKRKNVTVILGSADEAATWKRIREVPARTNNASDGKGIYAAPGSSSFCGHGLAALADGTLVTGLWGVGKETGFVQRSTDEGLTWSAPIYLTDPAKFKVYPSQIHQLRDGRLILMGGMYGRDEKPISANVRKYLFESRDGGKTWSAPIVLMPPDVGLCEESDFVELDNGDLLFSHRVEHYDGEKYLSSNRLQSIVKRKPDGGWDIGKATEVPMPHSGFPELLKTRDGSILHIGTDGIWQTGPGLYTWTKLDLPGSPYYPRAIQLTDGRILVVGHVGGDDEYGKVDQTIVQQTFRLAVVSENASAAAARSAADAQLLYTYSLAQDGSPASYDEAMAVASLQGVINRESPRLYVLSKKSTRPQYWLDLLSKDGRWLAGREAKRLADLNALVQLAGPRLKGAVIWDPAVPATINVATTIAGVTDAIVLSPELADRLAAWKLPILKDLRGQFTGAETGSGKNDAYRWAIREYLAKGSCSSHLLCLFEDSWVARAKGDVGYVVTRDWAVKNRAFVFDLSPWGDEKPGDDPDQKLGTDLETYKMILAETQRQAAGKHMTELTGFFAEPKYSNTPTHKSAHEGVPTEWETVWVMSPYNCYQNTISSDCFNQSLHSQAPRKPLKQKREDTPIQLENKTYVCILMADYDSATPLYDFLPRNWHDANRGKLPLTWGINPNLLETYPDLIAYFYETATPADTFTSDASCAGYINPNRIAKDSLPLFVKHNQQFFREADMTIAPMVLDRDQPSPDVKDAFAQFAPDGYATIIDTLGAPGGLPPPQVWKGMPILELFNDTCNPSNQPDQAADAMAGAIARHGNKTPSFYLFRHVWVNPTQITNAMAALRRKRPDLNIELVDARTFFALFKQSQEQKK